MWKPIPSTAPSHPEKTKAMAKCTACEKVLSVRVRADGTVDPIGIADCCESASYEVLETD